MATYLEKLKNKLFIDKDKEKKNKPIKSKKMRITIILPKPIENIMRGARNISGVSLKEARLLNAYDVIKAGKIIFMKESLDVLKKTFSFTKANKAK